MSAPNFNRIENYKLELCSGEIDRTTWWKDENRREPANVWWITGPGTSRPATEIEINLWLQYQKALDLMILRPANTAREQLEPGAHQPR